AKMSNTLDQLTGGRVLINIVTGGYPAELAADGDFTEHDDRYARTQEFMQVVRKAWTEETRWDHEGTYYRVEGGNVFPRPYQRPYPPFYFGGASEAARKVGAEETDVYLLWGETLPMVRERIADMRARAAAVGRTLRFGMRIHVIARETEAEAWAAADELVAHIPEGFQTAMDKILSRTDSEGEKRQQGMRKETEDLVIGPNLWTGIGKARVGVGAAIVGSGESVAARLKEYVDEGIETFILSGYPHLEEAQRFGKYVMPYFAGQRVEVAAATYRALYTGLLKAFFDLMPQGHLRGKVCIGLQTGTAREHYLSPDYGLRPLFASLEGIPVAGIYATDDEFVDGAPSARVLEW